jgi:hypothetical protein
MLRSLLAAALATAAALCSLDAHAQNIVLYGLIDASGSYSRPPGGDYRWQLDSGNMSRSYIGFRGAEDLGGGLRAVYRLESYFSVDTGSTGGYGGSAFWGRDANVGLSGAFGSTVLALIIGLVVVVLVIHLVKAMRKVPISSAKRPGSALSNFLPLPLNRGGILVRTNSLTKNIEMTLLAQNKTGGAPPLDSTTICGGFAGTQNATMLSLVSSGVGICTNSMRPAPHLPLGTTHALGRAW